MATVTELYEGRTETVGDEDPRATIPYLIEGVADEDAARTALTAAVSTYRTFGSNRLKIRDYTLELVQENGDESIFKSSVNYEKTDINDEEDPVPTRSGTTIGGTAHITQTLETVESLPVGGPFPDHKGAIGFDGENVQGVDIAVSAFTFDEIHYKTDDDMTPAYFGTLFRLSGTVNDDDVNTPIGNFNRGELLFLGVSWQRREDEIWELTFKFDAKPNKENQTFGDLNCPLKRGHEYIWFQYANGVDADATIKTPKFGFVERVYEESDFWDLDLDGWD
jgi:hypothetical protein